jgi:hypothetical protein
MIQEIHVDKFTLNVSSGSTVVSPFTSTVTVFVVSVAAKPNVPEFDV